MVEEFNILIVGVGGQGILTLSRVIAKAALSRGLKVRTGESLGMAQRGGSVQSHVRIGEDVYGPIIPERGANVVLALEPLEALRVVNYVGKKTIIILNTTPVPPTSVLLKEQDYPDMENIIRILSEAGMMVYPLNATRIAEEIKEKMALNMVMLGAFTALGIGPLTLKETNRAIAKTIPRKYLKKSLQAFKLGIESMTKVA